MLEIKNKILIILIILFGFFGFGSTQVFAEELRVAVASNFYPTMKKIIDLYELKKTNYSKLKTVFYLNFNVIIDTTANIIPIIQNLATILASCIPFFW